MSARLAEVTLVDTTRRGHLEAAYDQLQRNRGIDMHDPSRR